MEGIRNSLIILAIVVLVICAIGWLGIQIQPKLFPRSSQEESPLITVPLPSGLPEPVERFYNTVYGDKIPVIETVVISGRGKLKPFMNISIPTRFVFVHNVGNDYRHYFEATFFGIPVLRVNEGYIDGESFFKSPIASIKNDPNSNQAANLTLWAEAIWFPAIWLTDSRVRWESIDENSALLYVPFEKKEENFLVRFDPETGLIDTMETMRYRDTGENRQKILWILRNEYKKSKADSNVESVGSAMWIDQGSPWAYFGVKEIFVNVDESEYILQGGY